MKIYCSRLTKGMDLKLELERITKNANIGAGILLSSVGCVDSFNIRLADGKTSLSKKQAMEILSLNGTLSPNGVHIHITLSGSDSIAIGGHLQEGTIINTTCELVIGLLEEYTFSRKYDSHTGYNELSFKVL